MDGAGNDTTRFQTTAGEVSEVFKKYDGFDRLQAVALNSSGITPTEYKVLIRPNAVEETFTGSKILKPVDTQTKEGYATVKGVIVAVSPLAFSYASKAEWEAVNARPPQPGDKVIYAKYAGIRVEGRDGKEYLLINDKDVCSHYED